MIPRRLSRTDIATPLALFAVLIFTGSCAPEPPPRYPHVVLISLDTFRADHLGCMGNERVKTPSIDALAEKGTLFRSAISVVPTTLASHTSIMTGLYPCKHGVVRNGFMVNPENVMLAEVLEQEGFHTAAFLGSFALDRLFDFNQGFEHFDMDFDIDYVYGDTDQEQRRAEVVTDSVLNHLDELGDSEKERLFLFVHYFDAHAPYDPPAPYGAMYAREGAPLTSTLLDVVEQETVFQKPLIGPEYRSIFKAGLIPELIQGATGKPLPGDEDLAALYAGEVTYLDHQLGRLLDGLRERGVLDDAIVIITGDHGETFWEHADVWHHGAWVYETNTHIPLIVRIPDGRGAGKEFSTPVATIDIFPTVLDLLGIPLPEAVDGVSLVPVLDGGTLPERAIFSEATQPIAVEKNLLWKNRQKAKSVRRGRWKYVRAPYLGGLEQLFDLETDPGERVDLARNPNAHSQQELVLLKRAMIEWMSEERPRPSSFNSAQAEEVERKLRALGYSGEEPDEEKPEKKR